MQFDKDLNSEKAELFLEVREYITNEIEIYIHKVIEKYSDNITSLFCKEFSGGFCYLRVKDNYVHIGWFKGAKIEDKFGLLFGNGKHIRSQKINVLDEVCKKAISYYVEQSYILLIEKDAIKSLRK